MPTNSSLYVLPSLLSSCFTSNFWFYDYYSIIAARIPPYHLCSIPLVSYSYLIIPCVFPPWYHLLYFYVLLFACAHSTIFNACLWFEFIDTCVLIFARHLTFASSLVGEFWLPWILMSRFKAWSLWILPVADQRCASEAWIINRPFEALSFQAPLLGFRVFPLWLWTLICTVYDCIFLCILAFAPIRWCNILVILCHILW